MSQQARFLRHERPLTYTNVDNELLSDLADQGLRWADVGLLVYLLSKPADWSVRITHLAEQSADGVDAVKSILNRLRLAGYMRCESERDAQGKVVVWRWEYADHPKFAPNGPLHKGDFPQVVQPQVDFPQVVQPQVENPPLSNYGNPTNYGGVQKTDKTPPAETDDGFDSWWDVYPRREGKKVAKISYSKALAAGTSADDLRVGALWYAGQCKANKTEAKYVKMPATWLNQECWEDGVETSRAAAAELAMWHAAQRRLGWGTKASTASWFEDPTGVTDSIERQYHRKFGVYPKADPTLVEVTSAAPTPKLPAAVVDVPDDDGYVSDGDRRTLPDGRRQRYDEGADLWVAEHEWQPV